jgi:hypothetical protein
VPLEGLQEELRHPMALSQISSTVAFDVCIAYNVSI